MAFKILQRSTTITASDVNDNFYYIGCGNLLPMGGTSLSNTNGVYNLGSDNYRWDNIYMSGNISATTATFDGNVQIDKTYNLIYSYQVNENYSSTTRLAIGGLNGDEDNVYCVHIYCVGHSTATRLYFNGISTTNRYGELYFWYQTSPNYFHTDNSVSSYGVNICRSALSETYQSSFGQCVIYAKTGGYRLCFASQGAGIGEPRIENCYNSSIVWNNQTSTITSIVLTGQFYTGTIIKIYSMRS